MLTKRQTRIPSFLLATIVVAASCVTINLYFPEKEVQDLAEEIEKKVQEKAREEGAPGAGATLPQDPGAPAAADVSHRGRGSFNPIGALLGVTPAHAQTVPEPETTNPAIRKIIDSRAARLEELNRYKAQGVIGENNRGDVEVRDLGALSDLRARAEVQKLVRAENADREQLYKEVAAAKGIDPSQLDRIRETYADTLRRNARPGDWIQLADGSWKQR